MNFVSYTFLFAFLPLVLLLYYGVRNAFRSVILLAGSCLFYAWWRLDFLALLFFITVLDYVCAAHMARLEEETGRRFWLALSISGNLLVLGYFKYFNFGVDTLNHLLAALGWTQVGWPKVLLPIGISFYTFESMSYTIDVYRRKIQPARSLLHYASFIALFPHLIAGPIIRFKEIGPQILSRAHSAEKFARGVLFFIEISENNGYV